MDVLSELDLTSPIVRRALRIREKMYLQGISITSEEQTVGRDSTKQDWSKLELAPGNVIMPLCSARFHAHAKE